VAAAPAAPVAAAPAAPVAAAPAAPATPAGYAGVPWASLSKSQQAIALAKRGQPLAAPLQACTLQVNPAKPYRVVAGNNAHWWACVQTALHAGGGTAPAAAMVAAGACAKFVGYCVARGWLQKASA
jgi:hypothetical protein